MGIYNCERTLGEAVSSIRGQSFGDWELILCDDGSRDGTLALARRLAAADPRIKVMANETNRGLAPTLDRCATIARGEYFARMDGDDISEPRRLEKLVDALDANPDASLASSWMSCFDESGTWGTVRTEPRPGPRDFIAGTPYCHAPCMMRASAFRKVGGYGDSPWIHRVEDYNLWFKFAAAGLGGINLQEVLYRMRDDRDAVARRTFRARLNGLLVRWRGLGALGFPWWVRLAAAKPILTWLIPTPIYRFIRRRRLSR